MSLPPAACSAPALPLECSAPALPLECSAPALPFDYAGPPELAGPLLKALMRVIDPEVALSIVDIGLVYGLRVEAGRAVLRMTMTSAACPVADVIVEDVQTELAQALPAGCVIDVDVVWEPEWTPAMMSERARRFMA